MKAVILAGGLGTRLSEETESKPKPMVRIGGKPILWHIMKTYSYYGINDFIIGGSIGLNNRIFEEIQKQTSLISSQVIKFKKAQLKNDAELFGCFAKSAYFDFNDKYE